MNYKQFGKRSEMNKTIFTQKQKTNQKISLLSSIFFASRASKQTKISTINRKI